MNDKASPIAGECMPSFEEAMRRSALDDPETPGRQIMLCKLSARLAEVLTDDINRELAQFDLNLPRWQAMMWLSSMPGQAVNPSQICGAIAESPTGITRITDELVARGWIERRPSVGDRRRIELRMTSAGEALIKRVKPVVWNRLKTAFGGLNEAEMRKLEALTRKLLASVECQRAPARPAAAIP